MDRPRVFWIAIRCGAGLSFTNRAPHLHLVAIQKNGTRTGSCQSSLTPTVTPTQRTHCLPGNCSWVVTTLELHSVPVHTNKRKGAAAAAVGGAAVSVIVGTTGRPHITALLTHLQLDFNISHPTQWTRAFIYSYTRLDISQCHVSHVDARGHQRGCPTHSYPQTTRRRDTSCLLYTRPVLTAVIGLSRLLRVKAHKSHAMSNDPLPPLADRW